MWDDDISLHQYRIKCMLISKRENVQNLILFSLHQTEGLVSSYHNEQMSIAWTVSRTSTNNVIKRVNDELDRLSYINTLLS